MNLCVAKCLKCSLRFALWFRRYGLGVGIEIKVGEGLGVGIWIKVGKGPNPKCLKMFSSVRTVV